jgi:MurNAc alpha-1-phosphate uridylyltransferase
MKAMILAAGLGMRMRPLTNSMPKCMLQVGNKPLLHYHLLALEQAGISDVVINLGWQGRQISSYIKHKTNFSFKVHFSAEPSDNPLETGGGIRKALPLLGSEPFLVVNSDIWTDYPLKELLDYRLDEGALGCLVLVTPPEGAPADYALEGDMVRPVETDGRKFTFSGISLLLPDLFAGSAVEPLPERFPLRTVLEHAISTGKLRGIPYTDGQWRDIGTLSKLNQLRIHTSTSTS